MNYRNNDKKILCSVCIATFNRPAMLNKLLHSLLEQELPKNIILEVIVVDNDVEKSAKPIVDEFINDFSLNLYYFVQPKKNISLTRNLAVQKSSGEYLLFIDDDEIASKKWVLKLLDAVNKFNVDGVFGWVEPKFHNNAPLWVQKRELYFSPMSETGTVAKFTFTTNVIVRANIIKEENIFFEQSYGLTGGEDVHFFERLRENGARFINCREAITYEFIPPERTNKRYIYNRSLRGGQAYIRRQIESNKKIVFKIKIFIKSVSILGISGLLLLFSNLFRSLNLKILQIFGANIGKVRAILGVYKQHH